MQQLNIGQLRSTRHAALVPYERTKCVTFVRADATSTSQPPIAALAESIFLQLLKFHPPGAAESIFYEAAPSLDFAQVKRLYALTNGRYGRQITQRAALARQLATLAEIIHTRFSLFAAAGVSSLREYNAISPRAEKWHYVLIVGDGAIVHGHGPDESPLQMLQTICRQGPAAGIVMVLVSDDVADVKEQALQHHSEASRAAVLRFRQEMRANAFGFYMADQLTPH